MPHLVPRHSSTSPRSNPDQHSTSRHVKPKAIHGTAPLDSSSRQRTARQYTTRLHYSFRPNHISSIQSMSLLDFIAGHSKTDRLSTSRHVAPTQNITFLDYKTKHDKAKTIQRIPRLHVSARHHMPRQFNASLDFRTIHAMSAHISTPTQNRFASRQPISALDFTATHDSTAHPKPDHLSTPVQATSRQSTAGLKHSNSRFQLNTTHAKTGHFSASGHTLDFISMHNTSSVQAKTTQRTSVQVSTSRVWGAFRLPNSRYFASVIADIYFPPPSLLSPA